MSALLALALQTAAAPDQAAVRAQCSEEGSQVAFGQCLQRRAAESEQGLAAATARLRARLASWDENTPQIAAARAALARSAPAFLRYRQRQCGLAAAMAGGAIGTAREAWRLACMVELNLARAVMLDGFASGLPQR